MGRWITRYNAPSTRGVFWLNYVCGLLFSFLVLCSAGSEKYAYEDKNKAKWLGGLLGSIFSIVPYGIVGCVIAENWIWLIILSCIGLPLLIISTIYTYKKVVRKWMIKEAKIILANMLLSLEQSKMQGKITDEKYIEYTQELEKIFIENFTPTNDTKNDT